MASSWEIPKASDFYHLPSGARGSFIPAPTSRSSNAATKLIGALAWGSMPNRSLWYQSSGLTADHRSRWRAVNGKWETGRGLEDRDRRRGDRAGVSPGGHRHSGETHKERQARNTRQLRDGGAENKAGEPSHRETEAKKKITESHPTHLGAGSPESQWRSLAGAHSSLFPPPLPASRARALPPPFGPHPTHRTCPRRGAREWPS